VNYHIIQQLGPMKSDHLTLTLITLSGFHCVSFLSWSIVCLYAY